MQDTPDSAGSLEGLCRSVSLEDSPLAAGRVRKLVLPDLDEPANDSAAGPQRKPAARSACPEQQAAELPTFKLEQPALEAAALAGPGPAGADAGCTEHESSDVHSSASPEVFMARRQNGRGIRSQRVLLDSDEDSCGSSMAAATWASESSEVRISLVGREPLRASSFHIMQKRPSQQRPAQTCPCHACQSPARVATKEGTCN